MIQKIARGDSTSACYKGFQQILTRDSFSTWRKPRRLKSHISLQSKKLLVPRDFTTIENDPQSGFPQLVVGLSRYRAYRGHEIYMAAES